MEQEQQQQNMVCTSDIVIIKDVEHIAGYILDIIFSDGTVKRMNFKKMMEQEQSRFLDLDLFISELTYCDHNIAWGAWEDENIWIWKDNIYNKD
jgi:hypothetical protein